MLGRTYLLTLLACACSSNQRAALPAREPPRAPVVSKAADATALAGTPSCPEAFEPTKDFVRYEWLAAYAAVKDASQVWIEGEDEPETAERARELLCLETSGMSGMPPRVRATCTGEFWRITTDHQYYTAHTFIIVPSSTTAVVFDAGQIGGGLCSGEQSSTLSDLETTLRDGVLRIRATSESYEWSEAGPRSEACQRSHTDVIEYVYDLKSERGCRKLYVE